MRDVAVSSHLGALARAVVLTRGPVLELGMGRFSTPLLHWLCASARPLVSYDNDPAYASWAEQFRSDWHDVALVSNWDAAPIEQPWAVAFVDHAPADRRRVDIRRLATHAQVVVVHDTEWRGEKDYRYSEIYPLFKSRWATDVRPQTTLLSNHFDVSALIAWLT